MIAFLLIGLLMMGLLLFVLEWWARASTEQAKNTLMAAGLVLAGALALLFFARGQWLFGSVPLALSFYRFFGIARVLMRISSFLSGAKQMGGAGNQRYQQNQRTRAEQITEQEALDILGLQPGASDIDIQETYKRLMGQVHPDKGGSEWLAERLNAARDRLLKS